MYIKLTNDELRVIGCLIEKEVTTPDQYPLSLNALTNACNQKSNREPVMSLDESEVQKTLDGLAKKYLVVDKSSFGGRTSKFKHRFCNTELSDLQFSAQEVGILCVLFLRGPQTPGELRMRTNRLCKFSDVNEVEAVLEKLISHKSGPYVKKLARQPGKRESRYVHLFADTEFVELPHYADTATNGDSVAELNEGAVVMHESRILHLEKEIEAIRSELNDLKDIINQLI